MKEELIIAYIVNELDGKEKARVEEWIAVDDSHVDYYLGLREAWVHAMRAGKINHFDAEQGWREFKYKLRAKKRNIFLVRNLSRIAGAAAAMLVLFFGLYSLIKPIPQIKEFHATN